MDAVLGFEPFELMVNRGIERNAIMSGGKNVGLDLRITIYKALFGDDYAKCKVADGLLSEVY